MHQVLDADPKILVDAPILQLIGPGAAEHFRFREQEFRTRGSLALRSHVVTRSRFAEDRLAEAVQRGVQQYVILGAGLDTFGYRQPEWAHPLRIVEVDQPATQAAKRERMAAVGIAPPSNVAFAPVDFETVALRDALVENGVDLAAPVFLSWLGVTMYLTEAAVDAVLQTVATFAAGSEIVFTFSQPGSSGSRVGAGEMEGPSLAELAAEVGEPWLSYFEVPALEAKLRVFGFSNVSFLSPDEAYRRYFAGRTDALPSPRRISIVSAVV